MTIKYIILLCLIYYIANVNSFTHQEVKNLYKKIIRAYADNAHVSCNKYITHEALCYHFDDDEVDEVNKIIRKYGDKKLRLSLSGFKLAMQRGLIRRFNSATLLYKFAQINPMEAEERDYITRGDILKFYEEGVPKINDVMTRYGEYFSDEFGLSFESYAQAVNIGWLPDP